jgi:hypothetical protein
MFSDEKGQITVEAVLILGFFIMIFVGVTVPMTFNARYTAIDTSILTDAKFATEQIASAVNTVVVNGSKRTIDVYVPGYKAGSIHTGTRICTDGDYLNTTVLIVRYYANGTAKVSEAYDFSHKLYGGNWTLSTSDASATDRILEDEGRRYSIVIEYKSITSNTNNTMTDVTKAQTACALNLSGAPPAGW